MSTIHQRKSEVAVPGLSGPEKVAALIMALGKPNATKVLKLFDPDELQLVARSLAGLRPVAAADLEGLVEEFARNFAQGSDFVGTMQEAEALLCDVMTEEQIAQAMSDGPDEIVPAEPVWPRLADIEDELLGAYLLPQHPQTVAFILSRIDSDGAAKLIERLPPDLRSTVVCRMLGVQPVGDDADLAVQIVLREDLLTSQTSRHGEIAEILNKLDKGDSESLLAGIGQTRPDDAKALKAMLFSFEDVVTLSAAHRTLLFDQVPMERVVLSLSGTDEDFQSGVLSSLGARARRMAESELRDGSAPAADDVAEARRAIVSTVLNMIAAGEITRSNAGAEGEEG